MIAFNLNLFARLSNLFACAMPEGSRFGRLSSSIRPKPSSSLLERALVDVVSVAHRSRVAPRGRRGDFGFA